MNHDMRYDAGIVDLTALSAEVLARSACEHVFQRFTGAVDAGRATEAIALFDEDAVLELGGRTYSGRAEITAFLAAREAQVDRRTRHLTANFSFRLVGPDRGEAQALLVIFTAGDDEPPTPVPVAVSDCMVDFQRHPKAGWLMSARRHRRFAPA
jgi:SnoaL-like domain